MVVRVQSFYRRASLRVSYDAGIRNVLTIQAIATVDAARERFRMTVREDRYERAAVEIQSLLRGHSALSLYRVAIE